jgi:hypothetical protein
MFRNIYGYLRRRNTMSKKTKKAQIAENQEATNQTGEENQTMEVTQAEVEVVPATIVEGGQEQVFEGQTEGQEVSTEGESQVVESPMVANEGATQPTEKPAPKPRVNRRPYIQLVESHLELGDLDRKSLQELVLKEFPAVTKGGIGTFITDLKNVKYSHFKPRVAVEHPITKKFIFSDKVETQAVEAPVEAEAPVADLVAPTDGLQPEQPGE